MVSTALPKCQDWHPCSRDAPPPPTRCNCSETPLIRCCFSAGRSASGCQVDLCGGHVATERHRLFLWNRVLQVRSRALGLSAVPTDGSEVRQVSGGGQSKEDPASSPVSARSAALELFYALELCSTFL